jgi:hypothetical protein
MVKTVGLDDAREVVIEMHLGCISRGGTPARCVLDIQHRYDVSGRRRGTIFILHDRRIDFSFLLLRSFYRETLDVARCMRVDAIYVCVLLYRWYF